MKNARRALLAVVAAAAAAGCDKKLQPVDAAAATAAARLPAGGQAVPGRPEAGPEVTVTNVVDGGALQSGFVVGKALAPDGIERVEVSFDGAPAVVATGTVNWSVQVPRGADGWRQGSRHTIRLRAIDARGFKSPDVVMTVTRGRNLDINGDGYPDAAIGAPHRAAFAKPEVGSVFILYGNAEGIAASFSIAAETAVTGDDTSHVFGTAVAVGDLDDDGYADLVAGAPGAGLVAIFSGRPTGLPSGPAARLADLVVAGQPGFGSLLALGDVNADGSDDVVVGGAGGQLFVFHGGDNGVTATTDEQAQQRIAPASGGVSDVVIADVNGDGAQDLILGHAAAGGGAGVVELYQAITGGGLPRAPIVSASGQRGEGLGAVLAAGDFNGDGKTDVAAGAREGVVVFQQTASGLTLSMREAQRLEVSGAPATALAAGDFNGDGFDELAVGTAGEDGAGDAWLASGGVEGLAGVPQQLRRADARPGDAFASRLSAVADVNHDGLPDLLIGVPGFTPIPGQTPPRSGRVYVMHSSAATPMTAYDVEAGAARTLDGEGGLGEALSR